MVRSGADARRRWLPVAVVVTAVVFSFLVLSALPALAESGSLTPEQESLAARIDGKLIAPCCYTQTIAVHDSQKAQELKMQVRLLIAQGSDEKQILDTFVAQYGEKILAAPRASGFNWLAYLFPALVVLVAMAGVAMLVLRWRDGRAELVALPVRPQDNPSGGADPLRQRLEDELSHYDP
ncbi:MAG: cytochrome c-type biogenesis protein [Thermoleophilia bacterium]